MNCVRSKLFGAGRRGVMVLGLDLQRNLASASGSKEVISRLYTHDSAAKKDHTLAKNSLYGKCIHRSYSEKTSTDTFIALRNIDPSSNSVQEEKFSSAQERVEERLSDDSLAVSENHRVSRNIKRLAETTREHHDSRGLSESPRDPGLPQHTEEYDRLPALHGDPNSTSTDLPVSVADGDWTTDMDWVGGQEETRDVLAAPRDAAEMDVLAPELRPTFNLAAYVNNSPTLQQMVKLGVDLSRLEKRRGIANFVLRLDFDTDMRDHIRFLNDAGVVADDLGRWLTINPLVFKEDLANLEARLGYLEDMGFTSDQVARIITRNPYWLLFSKIRIDNRLGFFQRTFELSGDEVRALTTREPRLITLKLSDIKRTNFAVLEEMGFSQSEMKSLLLTRPKLWMAHGVSLLRRFDYAHNTMGLTHTQVVQFPHILTSRDFRLRQRHSFLRSIGRAQYDPTAPGYVSPQQLVAGDDVAFCTQVAKASVQDFNAFLKTI